MFQENLKTTLAAAPEAQAIDQVTENFLNELAELDILYTSTDDADKSKQELRNKLSGSDPESLFNFLDHNLIKLYWKRPGTPDEISERQRKLFAVLLAHRNIFTQSTSAFVEGFASKGLPLENAEGAFVQTLQSGEAGLGVFRPIQTVSVAATGKDIPAQYSGNEAARVAAYSETETRSSAMSFAEVISMLRDRTPIFTMRASNRDATFASAATSLSILPRDREDHSTKQIIHPMINLISQQLAADKDSNSTACELGGIKFDKGKVYIVIQPSLGFGYIGDVSIDKGQRLKLKFMLNTSGNAVGGEYTEDSSIYILEVNPGATITMTSREATVAEGIGNAAKRGDRKDVQKGSWRYVLAMQDNTPTLVNTDVLAASRSAGQLVSGENNPYWKLQFPS